ncbi:MAG: GNAT family N-acetyltransferase [Eubacterium sp.]|nr:GNAT family N-acetyltransferase [Eubacterium sp.]
MTIREAKISDIEDLMFFYDKMCEYLGQKAFLPNGNKGGFPPRKMVETAIAEHNQFVGIKDDHIIAAYIMNHEWDAAYDTVTWQIDAKKEAVVTLHALRVLPEHSGFGYARQLVEHAIETAKQRGILSIRLDCIEGNDVPQKMYMSYGFRYIDTVEITYEDIGVPRKFLVYELVL